MGVMTVRYSAAEADLERRIRNIASNSGKPDSTVVKELLALGLDSQDRGMNSSAAIEQVRQQLADLVERTNDVQGRLFKTPEAIRVVLVSLLEVVMLLRSSMPKEKLDDAQRKALNTYEGLSRQGHA